MSANKVGDDGRIQSIGFVAIASTARILFDAPWVQQAHPVTPTMEP